MDNYLLDRETLGKFVDELMSRKSLPDMGAEDAAKYREEKMGELDRQVGLALFDQLDDAKLAEFNELMDRDDSAGAYESFFKAAGIDVEKVIADAMREFGEDYLGGRNA